MSDEVGLKEAQDESTEPRRLQHLAGHSNWRVRYFVARNSATPMEVLLVLVKDESKTVASEAALRINALGGSEELERQREEARSLFIQGKLSRIEATLAEGRKPYLHALVFVPSEYWVGSNMGGVEPSTSPLFDFGLDGWEISSSIPRTIGITPLNTYGQPVWGQGGLGGMVDGAYMVLRMTVSRTLLDSRPELVVSALSEEFDRQHLGPRQTRHVTLESAPALLPAASTAMGVGMVSTVGAFVVTEYEDEADSGGDFDFGE